jgi:FAD/FMN-containing dehydrogenase
MRGIRVDPVSRTVRAEPGLTWKELDHETLAFGLATTGGTVSHTGIAGLTVGGGVGWQMARHGLTCDNLLSVDQAHEVLRFYRDYSQNAPDDLTAFAGLLTTPDGNNVAAIIAAWFGHPDEAAQFLGPLRKFGAPLADLIGQLPYGQLQTLFDDAAPFGLRRYWKSGYFPEFPNDLIELIVKHAATKSSPYSLILFFHIHGAAARVQPDATAFGARATQWDFDIITQWQAVEEDAQHIEWARNFWKEVEPFTRGVYPNHLDADDSVTRVRVAYGQNYERLVSLKSTYDPGNLFRMNNNIPPSAERA